MPVVPINNIDALITYINDNWYQNNVQAITGQKGLNVVGNLGTLLKQNPENWDRATVLSTPSTNYTPTSLECMIICVSPSSGEIDRVDNIWNKWYYVNATDNARDLTGGKVYYDLNGNTQNSIPPRSVVAIAKGNDDFWYQFIGLGGGGASKPPLIGVVGGGTANDPVNGTSVFQSNRLIGLAQANAQRCQIELDAGILQNFGNNISFILDNVTGEIDISPNQFVTDQTLYIDLNQ